MKEMDMPATHPGRTTKYPKHFALTLLLAGVLAAMLATTAFIVWQRQTEKAAPVAASGIHAVSDNQAARTTPAATGAGPGQDAIQAGQSEAMNALLAEIGSKPLSAPPTQRPDFVSPLEWQVLQGVAGQHARPDQELLRLVNNLRFNKALELWRSGTIIRGSSQALALEKQLLDEIPSRVVLQEMGLAEAQPLQLALLKDLVPDATERQQRAEEEAARLGVTFSIKEAVAPSTKEAAAPPSKKP